MFTDNQSSVSPPPYSEIKDDAEAVRLHSAYGVDPTVVHEEAGLSGLHIAARNGDAAGVRYLLKTQTDLIDAQDNHGNTPLHLAVQNGRDKIIVLLLEAGAFHEMKNDQGQMPADVASPEKKWRTENLIRKTVRDLNSAKSKEIDSRLHQISHMQEKIRLLQLLLAPGLDYNRQDRNGETIIHAAVKLGDTAVITALQGRRDVNLNIQNNKGETPIYCAALAGQEEVVKTLISAGVDVNLAAQDGTTAVHAAAKCNHSSIIRVLASAGANVNKKALDEQTPLCIATREGYKETVEALITARADVNTTGTGDRTPLYIAAATKEENKAGAFGRTPAYAAAALRASENRREIVTILLNAGADASMDIDGKTIAEVAGERGYSVIAEQLRKHVEEHPYGIRGAGENSAVLHQYPPQQAARIPQDAATGRSRKKSFFGSKRGSVDKQ